MGNLRSCTVVLVLVWWFCLAIVIGGSTTSTLAAADTIGNFNHSTDALGSQTKLNPNSMSKRRVPNGPDPIHNRYISLLC